MAAWDRANTDEQFVVAWTPPPGPFTEPAAVALAADDELASFLIQLAAQIIIVAADKGWVVSEEGQPLVALRKLWTQLILGRAVDNFLTYLADLVALLYRTRSETLRAETQRSGGEAPSIPISQILEHGSMEDLISTIVERRVNEVAYLGIPGLSDYLERRLGFKLFDSETDRIEAVRVVEGRNIIVHNRGRINRIYLQRLGSQEDDRLGRELDVDPGSLFRDLRFLRYLMLDIDRRAIEKWKLPTDPIGYSPTVPGLTRPPTTSASTSEPPAPSDSE